MKLNISSDMLFTSLSSMHKTIIGSVKQTQLYIICDDIIHMAIQFNIMHSESMNTSLQSLDDPKMLLTLLQDMQETPGP